MQLQASGAGPSHRAYRQSLSWWEEVLQAGVEVPLAPQLHFPACGAPGCLFVFTDAAREKGTGFGGFSLVKLAHERAGRFLFMAQSWDYDSLRALQADELSMPAGEMFGAVTLLDAAITHLGRVTHAICFTDSVATANGLTTAASHAPQLNAMLSWLFERHRGVQFLGVHQRGLRNQASDRLSRGRGAAVLAEAEQSGLTLVQLFPHKSAKAMLIEARRLPTRGASPDATRVRRRRPKRRPSAQASPGGRGPIADSFCAEVAGIT